MRKILIIDNENKQQHPEKEENDGWFDVIGDYAQKFGDYLNKAEDGVLGLIDYGVTFGRKTPVQFYTDRQKNRIELEEHGYYTDDFGNKIYPAITGVAPTPSFSKTGMINLINKPSTPGHTLLKLKTNPGEANHVFGFIGNELIKAFDSASEPMKKVINSRIFKLKEYVRDIQKSGKSVDFDDLEKFIRDNIFPKRGRKPIPLTKNTVAKQIKAGTEGSSEVGTIISHNGTKYRITGFDKKTGRRIVQRLEPTPTHIKNWTYHTKDATQKGTKFSSPEERMKFDPYYRPSLAGRPKLGESNKDLFIKGLNNNVPEIKNAQKLINKAVIKGMSYDQAFKKYAIPVLKELGLIL